MTQHTAIRRVRETTERILEEPTIDPAATLLHYGTQLRRLFALTGEMRFLRAAKILQPMPRKKAGRPAYDDAAYTWRIHVLATTTKMRDWAAAGRVARKVPLRGAAPYSVQKRLYDRYRSAKHKMPNVEAELRELTASLDAGLAQSKTISTGLDALVVGSDDPVT